MRETSYQKSNHCLNLISDGGVVWNRELNK